MRDLTETEKASSEIEKDEEQQPPNKQIRVSGDVICHRHMGGQLMKKRL